MYLRSMIVAPKDHYLIQCDLSQAESWVTAYLAREEGMKNALLTGDIHCHTASFILDEVVTKSEEHKSKRYLGKKCNHAFNYRMGPYKAAETINKEGILTVTNSEAKKYRDKYLSLYRIQNWWKEIEEDLRNNRTLRNPYGREHRFFERWGEELFKQATAFLPQSTVAAHFYGVVQEELEIVGGLLAIRDKLRAFNSAKLTNTAHDSVIVECKRADYKDVAIMMIQCLHRPMLIHGEECLIPVDCEYGERLNEGMDKFKMAA